jgi:hypothetical protein
MTYLALMGALRRSGTALGRRYSVEGVNDRLSPLDSSFLAIEDGVSHMHIASIGIFEGPIPRMATWWPWSPASSVSCPATAR